MRWTVKYYNQQVVEAVKHWPIKMRGKYLKTIELIEEHGPHLGKPFTSSLKNGLFEVRIKAAEGIGRAFFCYQRKNEIIILHAFVKKTQKTPKKELEIATQRLKEIK